LAPRGRPPTGESSVVAAAFDGRALIFATGLAGMALSIVLMFLYQSHFGSLFLHIGLISSLFMFGSFVGSLLSERLVAGERVEPPWLLPVCLLINLVLIAVVMAVPQAAHRVVYAGLFTACGAFVGVYFPIAAGRLQAAGRSAAASGSSLEMLDHLGGAAGALLAGWLLLPVLGTWLTLCVLAMLVGVNFLPLLVPARVGYLPPGADRFDRLVRPAGYILLGIAASVLAASHIVAAIAAQQAGERVIEVARAMTGSDNLTTKHATLKDGTAFSYWELPDSEEKEGGFVFATNSLAQGVSGYGGPVEMAVFVSRNGTLRDARIVRSHETPAYVESIADWLHALPGRNVFDPADIAGVDAVSGATMTSAAILQTLQQAGPRFASGALGMEVRAAAPEHRHRPDLPVVGLAVLLGLAVGLRRVPNAWVRRAMLLAALVTTGFLWNLQYSSQQVMAVLSFNLPGNWLSGSFLLVLLVPVVVLLVGNVYCGYVCPFGALQELVGDLRPRRLDTDPPKKIWRYGRAVKYLLLALLVVLFALTRDYRVLSADPLLTVFSSHRDLSILCVAVGLVALSFVFRRFWCRNLCPAGAFLSLLCGAKLLGRLMPRAGPARCDLGVRAAKELDCLCCDRCRHAKT
jgi:Na+-translocating ferredoxin:NAD+ oxidoreductase RnfG subunit